MIVLIGDQPPVLTTPADLELSCEEDPSDMLATGTATALDNCDLAPTVTYSDVTSAGLCPGDSTIERTWTATDACGNESTSVQTITIVDDIAPSILPPADAELDCPGDLSLVEAATATDLCDPVPTMTFVDTQLPSDCP